MWKGLPSMHLNGATRQSSRRLAITAGIVCAIGRGQDAFWEQIDLHHDHWVGGAICVPETTAGKAIAGVAAQVMSKMVQGVPVSTDLGNLAVFDINPLDETLFR